MNATNSYAVPVTLSLVLHALVLAAVLFGWVATPSIPESVKPPMKIVQATLIHTRPQVEKVQPEPQRVPPPPEPEPEPEPKIDPVEELRKQRELEQQKRREAEAARKREAELQRKRERKQKAEAEKRRKEQEQKRLAEEQRKAEAEKRRLEEQKRLEEEKRLAEEKRRKEEEQRLLAEKRKRVEQFLREQAARQEQAQRDAEQAQVAVQSYQAAIQQHVAKYWSRPPSARNDMQVTLQIQLVPGGEVIDVVVLESSGNEAFDRSAKQALLRAGKLPVPEDPRIFDKSFRRFKMRFRPEDLSW